MPLLSSAPEQNLSRIDRCDITQICELSQLPLTVNCCCFNAMQLASEMLLPSARNRKASDAENSQVGERGSGLHVKRTTGPRNHSRTGKPDRGGNKGPADRSRPKGFDSGRPERHRFSRPLRSCWHQVGELRALCPRLDRDTTRREVKPQSF